MLIPGAREQSPKPNESIVVFGLFSVNFWAWSNNINKVYTYAKLSPGYSTKLKVTRLIFNVRLLMCCTFTGHFTHTASVFPSSFCLSSGWDWLCLVGVCWTSVVSGMWVFWETCNAECQALTSVTNWEIPGQQSKPSMHWWHLHTLFCLTAGLWHLPFWILSVQGLSTQPNKGKELNTSSF